jgi:DNA-binding XRE family transcriptional regulator
LGRRQPAAGPPSFELGGRRYVVLRASDYERLVAAVKRPLDEARGWPTWEEDAARLGERLAERRKGTGLTQAALARAAGLRVETLNRIERGRQNPDFTTVRKLVAALHGPVEKRRAVVRRRGGEDR